jgi:hypothetical protein
MLEKLEELLRDATELRWEWLCHVPSWLRSCRSGEQSCWIVRLALEVFSTGWYTCPDIKRPDEV